MNKVEVILLDQCIALCVTNSILLCFNGNLRHIMGTNIFCIDLVLELYISFTAQPSLSGRKPLQQPVASLHTGKQLTGSTVLGWGAQRAGLAFRGCKSVCACVRVCVCWIPMWSCSRAAQPGCTDMQQQSTEQKLFTSPSKGLQLRTTVHTHTHTEIHLSRTWLKSALQK